MNNSTQSIGDIVGKYLIVIVFFIVTGFVAFTLFAYNFKGSTPEVAFCNNLSDKDHNVKWYDTIGIFKSNLDLGHYDNINNNLTGCYEVKLPSDKEDVDSVSVKYIKRDVPTNLKYTDIPNFYKSLIIALVASIPLTILLFGMAGG